MRTVRQEQAEQRLVGRYTPWTLPAARHGAVDAGARGGSYGPCRARRSLVPVLLLLACALLPCLVRGNAVFVESTTFTLNGFESPDAWITSVTLNQYNPVWDNGLPLVRVDVVITATLAGNLLITNNSSDWDTIGVIFDTTVDAQLGATTLASVSPTFTDSYYLAGGASVTPSVSAGPVSDTYTDSTPPFESAFTGTGTFNLTITAAGNVPAISIGDPTGKNPFLDSSNETISGTITVYYYTPEPSTMALLCLLGGAAALRRPRRRRQTVTLA